MHPGQFLRFPVLFSIELGALAVALLTAWTAPALGEPWFRPLESALGRFARRPVLSLVAVALLPIFLRLLLLPVLPPPEPWVHDEFANLLGADTFAHGRLTNPTHPMWMFFETMHVLEQPTYASMYPPAQAGFLALGQVLTGMPWAGVILSMAVFSAVLLWMLRGWLPPGWALLGAGLAIVRLGLFSYWMNSYWGGAPAAIGGALVAGAVPRIVKRRRWREAVLLGIGLVLLANTRPFEGLMFSLPFGIYLLIRMLRRPAAFLPVAIPLAAVLAAGTAWLGYYNWRVTGDPAQFPELLHERLYSVAPNFVWGQRRPDPRYNHAVLREFYTSFEPTFADFHNPLKALTHKGLDAFTFFLGPLLAMPLVLAPRTLASGRIRLLVAAVLCEAIALGCIEWSFRPHYAAPCTAALYALVLQGARGVRLWKWRGLASGRLLVRAIPVVALLMVAVRLSAASWGLRLQAWPPDWSVTTPSGAARAQVLERLHEIPDRFLLIVRYRPGHPTWNEWVYNEADIDNAQVVWARELPGGEDPLIAYFRGRTVLVIEPDANPIAIHPYGAQ